MGEYGWWGNFWQLGKLDQVWEKYERNGEVCWNAGVGKGRCGKMCYGRCGKCVGVGVGRVGKYGEMWEMWGRCVDVCLGCGKV